MAKKEKTIHEEFTQGGLIGGTPRTLTYFINKKGELESSKYVAEGSSLNSNRIIYRNPIYEILIGEAISLGFSSAVGSYIGTIYSYSNHRSLNEGVICAGLVALILNLALRPVVSDITMENKIDRTTWKKYKEYLKNIEQEK